MTLLKTIFRHEWQQLLRQRWLLLSLLLFVVIGLLSIRSANHTVRARFVQGDSIRLSYARSLDMVVKKFSDTLTDKGKVDAKNAGLPVMINFWLPQNVIKDPGPLSALSLGLMDVQPWHRQVKYTKNYDDTTDMPVSNPMTLFAGNFDLAFVIIYLLPLLVLTYCYAIHSSEKEAGTLALLTIQSGSIHRIIRLKLLFRFLVLASVLMIINVFGFVLAEKHSSLSEDSILWWSVLSLLYLLFWTGIAYLVVALQKGAIASGLYLVSSWVLLLIVLPSMVNTYIQSRHPLPMKDELASYRRHQGEEIWGTSARILSDSFNRYNPQYASSINPAKDTVHLSMRYVAGYYDLLERRMERVIIPFEEQVAQRNDHFASFSRWIPALSCQHLFNCLAGTQLLAYQEFFQQADVYQEKWKDFLYAFHIPGKKLTQQDMQHFPVFHYQQPLLPVKELATAVGYLLLLVAGLFVSGFFLFNKINKPA